MNTQIRKAIKINQSRIFQTIRLKIHAKKNTKRLQKRLIEIVCSVIDDMKSKQLTWLGKIQQMSERRIEKRFNWSPNGIA